MIPPTIKPNDIIERELSAQEIADIPSGDLIILACAGSTMIMVTPPGPKRENAATNMAKIALMLNLRIDGLPTEPD